MTVKDRIQEYIDYKGISIYRLEASAGLSKGYWAKTKSISADVVMKISRIYTDISTDWLLRGEGEMLRANDNDVPAINYSRHGVPYYNVDFIGGFDLVENDQTTNPEYYIDFKKFNTADCWCNVTGHSMEPEIASGDIIALKELKDWRTYMPSGEIYGIVTTEHRTIKKVCPSDKDGYITLIPSNPSPEFKAQDIPLSIVKRVYKVLGCMRKL